MKNPSHAAATCLLRDVARQIRAAAFLMDRAETYLDTRELARLRAIHGSDVISNETARELEEFAAKLNDANWRAA